MNNVEKISCIELLCNMDKDCLFINFEGDKKRERIVFSSSEVKIMFLDTLIEKLLESNKSIEIHIREGLKPGMTTV